MTEEPIFRVGRPRTGWRRILPAAVDAVSVFRDHIIIHQRTVGGGDVHIPIDSLTEVRAARIPGGFFRPWRLHLRVGGKKYVVRHLSQQQAEGLAAAIAQQRSPGY